MEMVKYRILASVFFSAGILFQGCDSDVKCRNDKGAEVDWYILYKLPQMKDDGLSYLYMDESTGGWKLSTMKISSESGTLANTLKPLFDYYVRKTEGFGYMLYNDQPPEPYKTASVSYGHSKGVVMLDRQTGVWLSHSTPKFPTYQSEVFWPKSGSVNAQTFMCVTFSYKEFKNIGVQLKYIHPFPFDFVNPPFVPEELKCVAQQRCYPKTPPWSSVKYLTSMRGRNFLSFAKYTRFGDDLYSGLIASYLKQSLRVKSWGSMRQPLPSNCSIPHHVYNVKQLQLNGRSFSDTVDHSKWCVVPDGGWTCIADMNREGSQMKRGGGAICTEDFRVAKVFSDIIKWIEPCKRAPLNCKRKQARARGSARKSICAKAHKNRAIG